MDSPARAEKPFVLWLQAALAGAAVLGLAWLLQPPLANADGELIPFRGHGESFAAQSADPWSLQGAFPQRILWPLLAHVCGLGGDRSPIFSQLSSGILLAVVFWFCRRRGARPGDALLVTLAVGVTGAVQLYQVMSCHSDSWNWILMLLLLHHVARPFVYWSLVFVCALSHEMIFFFAPWLVYLRWRQSGRLLQEGAAMAGAVGLYQVWRKIVEHRGGMPSYDASYYLEHHLLPWGMPGLWLLFVLVLLVEFGPLLAVVVWGVRDHGLGWGRFGPLLYLLGVLPLMGFAHDVPRFACYAFLPLVVASVPFLQRPRGRAIYVVLLVLSAGTCFGTHLRLGIDGGWAFELARQRLHRHGVLEQHSRFFTEVLPATWPWVLLVAACAAAVLVTGLRLRPYLGTGRAPRTSANASP